MNRPFDNDKRRYIRYEVLDYVQVFLPETDIPLNTVIVDIGLGGLQLRSREPLPVHEIIRIQVGRDEATPLALMGEVRHSSPVPESDLFATGVRFTPESHDERMAIAEYVHAVFQRQCDMLVN